MSKLGIVINIADHNQRKAKEPSYKERFDAETLEGSLELSLADSWSANDRKNLAMALVELRKQIRAKLFAKTPINIPYTRLVTLVGERHVAGTKRRYERLLKVLHRDGYLIVADESIVGIGPRLFSSQEAKLFSDYVCQELRLDTPELNLAFFQCIAVYYKQLVDGAEIELTQADVVSVLKLLNPTLPAKELLAQSRKMILTFESTVLKRGNVERRKASKYSLRPEAIKLFKNAVAYAKTPVAIPEGTMVGGM